MTRVIVIATMMMMLAGCTQQETFTMTGEPQGLAVQGEPAAGPLSTMDRDFMREAAMGGQMEVELGRLATRNAAHPRVREFGERMVRDHTRANQQLADIASRSGVTLPQQLSGHHRDTVDRLAELRGAEFDRAYMRSMVEDHEQDVAKFREMSERAGHPDLRDWAAMTLPILEEHLRMARDIHAQIESQDQGARDRGGAATRPAAGARGA